MKSKKYGVLELNLCWTTVRKSHRMDTGMSRHRLGLDLQKIRSSPMKPTKDIPNLNPGLCSTLSLARIEMTCLNTIIPCLRVTAD